MPQTQGAAIPGWDLSQYPNTAGSPTTPIALDQSIVALVNGGTLAAGDYLARISDIKTGIVGATKNVNAPLGNNKKLLTTADIRDSTEMPLTLLNGFVATAGYCVVTISETLLAITLLATTPANVAQGTKICDLPFPVARATQDQIAGSSGAVLYTSGSAVYAGVSTTASNMNCSFLAMRI
jgi:hypothetical protein